MYNDGPLQITLDATSGVLHMLQHLITIQALNVTLKLQNYLCPGSLACTSTFQYHSLDKICLAVNGHSD